MWKANLAFDHELPWYGIVASAEVLLTDVKDGLFYRTLNVGPGFIGPDGRVLYWNPSSTRPFGNTIAPAYARNRALPQQQLLRRRLPAREHQQGQEPAADRVADQAVHADSDWSWSLGLHLHQRHRSRRADQLDRRLAATAASTASTSTRTVQHRALRDQGPLHRLAELEARVLRRLQDPASACSTKAAAAVRTATSSPATPTATAARSTTCSTSRPARATCCSVRSAPRACSPRTPRMEQRSATGWPRRMTCGSYARQRTRRRTRSAPLGQHLRPAHQPGAARASSRATSRRSGWTSRTSATCSTRTGATSIDYGFNANVRGRQPASASTRPPASTSTATAAAPSSARPPRWHADRRRRPDQRHLAVVGAGGLQVQVLIHAHAVEYRNGRGNPAVFFCARRLR